MINTCNTPSVSEYKDPYTYVIHECGCELKYRNGLLLSTDRCDAFAERLEAFRKKESELRKEIIKQLSKLEGLLKGYPLIREYVLGKRPYDEDTLWQEALKIKEENLSLAIRMGLRSNWPSRFIYEVMGNSTLEEDLHYIKLKVIKLLN